MTTINIAETYSKVEISAPGLRLDDYAVCRKLSPFVLTATEALSKMTLPVERIEINSTHVRAVSLVGQMTIEKPLPKGLHGHLLDLSAGPVRAFPKTDQSFFIDDDPKKVAAFATPCQLWAAEPRRIEKEYNRTAHEALVEAENAYLRANHWREEGDDNWTKNGRSLRQGHAVNSQKYSDRASARQTKQLITSMRAEHLTEEGRKAASTDRDIAYSDACEKNADVVITTG